VSEPHVHWLGRHLGPDLTHRVMIIKNKLVTVSKWRIYPTVFLFALHERISKEEATSLPGLLRIALGITRGNVFVFVAFGEWTKGEAKRAAFELASDDPTIPFGTVGSKSDDPADLTMPEIGQKLLPFIVPKKLRDAVTGDLTEDFRTFATRWGRSYALRWLWWELAGLCIRRFGPTAIITTVGVWFRQKLGW